jgi:ABC-2 type transport system permease protein
VTRLRHTARIAERGLRALLRQPAWVGITLVQPVIWLLLFGQLFTRVADIPGFSEGSYGDFLAPGVVVMTAISTAGWAGMALIDDMDRGVMDRFLVSPVWRPALTVGGVVQTVLVIAVQSAIVLGLALLTGATIANGVGGAILLVAIAALLGASFAALSNGVALLARQRETLIGVVTTVVLPLTFVSSVYMQASLLPHWMQDAARFNPVAWAADAGRSVAIEQTDWSLVATRVALLTALLVACCAFATRAFGAYQRSR